MSTVSAKNFTERLNRLRLAKDWTWEQTAKSIGLSRTMIHFIKTEKHPVSDKVIHRLERAEVEADLLSPQNAAFNSLMRSPLAIDAMENYKEIVASWSRTDRFKVTSEDVNRGYVDIPIDYRRRPPSGGPKKLRLSAISSMSAAKLQPKILQRKDAEDVLLNSLPPKNRSDDFLNELTPGTLTSMICASVILGYGLKEGKELLVSLGYKFD